MDGTGFETMGCTTSAVPESIRDILRRLKGRRVVIVIKGCCRENVQILDVTGELLVCRFCGAIKFVRIECICEVITNCPDLFLQF